jgi:deazaflavin-dependent oxidoreductase (nitroreductase family)
MAKNYARGFGPRGIVLLLSTTGRKSGLPRITPLQFEEQNGIYFVGSARGQGADWFLNILKNPEVGVQIGDLKIKATAEPITNPEQIADYLEMRLKNHPIMLRLIMLTEGLPLRYNRSDLISIAQEKAVVALNPMNT